LGGVELLADSVDSSHRLVRLCEVGVRHVDDSDLDGRVAIAHARALGDGADGVLLTARDADGEGRRDHRDADRPSE
jgi:hypothetical protein